MSELLAGSIPELVLGSPWAYAVIGGSIAGSAVFPPLPSESILVTAMSLAVAGEFGLVAVCVTTTMGMFLGDLVAYGLGRSLSGTMQDRAAGIARARSAMDWLRAHKASWGPGLIIAGRFIPGGTTTVGISAGVLRYSFRQFALFAALGAMLWTTYGLLLALFGRAVFPGNTWAGVILAIALALGTGSVLHMVRVRRRKSQ